VNLTQLYINSPLWFKDDGASYSIDCNGGN